MRQVLDPRFAGQVAYDSAIVTNLTCWGRATWDGLLRIWSAAVASATGRGKQYVPQSAAPRERHYAGGRAEKRQMVCQWWGEVVDGGEPTADL